MILIYSEKLIVCIKNGKDHYWLHVAILTCTGREWSTSNLTHYWNVKNKLRITFVVWLELINYPPNTQKELTNYFAWLSLFRKNQQPSSRGPKIANSRGQKESWPDINALFSFWCDGTAFTVWYHGTTLDNMQLWRPLAQCLSIRKINMTKPSPSMKVWLFILSTISSNL
jgi:hypothetical protein